MKERGRTDRAKAILQILDREYDKPKGTLKFATPLELLLATILAAQCTDERVNMVTKELFAKGRAAADWAALPIGQIEQEVASTGFFRQKAKRIKECCRIIAEEHGGIVPQTMEELTAMPGIGRKSANLIRGGAYGVPGVVVDTHVVRVTKRLDLTENTNPDKIEIDLCDVIPKERWFSFSWQIIMHGRAVCTARKPACSECHLNHICVSAFKV
jgi:endonuclease-3